MNVIYKLPFIIGVVFIPWIWACHKNASEPKPEPQPSVPFDTVPVSVPVPGSIIEASGIAASKKNPGYLWVHEDSGTPAQILLLKTDGTLSKTMSVSGATNVDWEDMSLGKGPNPSLDYIYLADIGDNLVKRTDCAIYRFPEPTQTDNAVSVFDKILFHYPDGSHDAEAIFVDNSTADIFIVTKSGTRAGVYKISYPQSTTAINQAVSVGELTFGGVTSAGISPDAKEIIIKTYPALNYFVRGPGETIENTLKKSPTSLAYQLEPQGEAIAFAADNSGFYTLSEKSILPVVNLYFYKRK